MSDQPTSEELSERIAILEEQNARLRRLLDANGAPEELRHRLRATLSLLRMIIRRSASTREDVSDYVAHLEDRLEAISRAQSMGETHGGVNVPTLVAEQMLSYGLGDDMRASFDGPEVMVSTRIGQTLALALHELTVNSVEHGALGGEIGSVSLTWNTLPNSLELVWNETGPTISPSDRKGFGSDFIINALPYQHKARVEYVISEGTLRCLIAIPI